MPKINYQDKSKPDSKPCMLDPKAGTAVPDSHSSETDVGLHSRRLRANVSDSVTI